jgi:hypothetical protein
LRRIRSKPQEAPVSPQLSDSATRTPSFPLAPKAYFPIWTFGQRIVRFSGLRDNEFAITTGCFDEITNFPAWSAPHGAMHQAEWIGYVQLETGYRIRDRRPLVIPKKHPAAFLRTVQKVLIANGEYSFSENCQLKPSRYTIPHNSQARTDNC